MDIASGQVGSIRYTNPDNGWTVATIAPPGKWEEHAIVGIMPGLTEGAEIEATGQWVEDPKWGRQFKVTSFRTEAPTDSFGLQTYLENAISGIGYVLAERIVAKFGDKTPDIMTDITALMTIEGIGKGTAASIAGSWTEHEAERRALQDIYGFLAEHELSPTLAHKLSEKYGFDAVLKIKENPYRLMELERVGFKRADAVAKAMGVSHDDPRRVKAGLTHITEQSTQYGNCYVEHDSLIETVQQELIPDLQYQTIEHYLTELLEERPDLVHEDDSIYPRRLYEAEKSLASDLAEHHSSEMCDKLSTFQLLSDREIQDRLPSDITYTSEQLEAIAFGLRNRISIITGGPGTGKSTIIRGLVEAAESAWCNAVLMAPTGLAAKRMIELSGHDAATVHRTLGVDPLNGGFVACRENKLEGDLFIVDESSMLDIGLAASLVEAIPAGSNLVFVGDIDQLPSVGPGNVLRDLISSEHFPVTRLTTIFRQSDESLIIPNAHAINSGEMPDFSTSATGDFYLFPATETGEAADWVIDLVTQRIPQSLGIPADEIRVLSPQKKTDAGVYALNKRLQEVLNPPSSFKAELTRGDRVFRVGDRILRVAKNDYRRMIVNGDQGTIVSIDKDDNGKPRIWVKLEGRGSGEEDTFDFTGEDISTLRHGWALTIHKSQGLEFRAAVVVVVTAHYRMLVRNLLYTAITRAREKVVIVGNRKALGIAVGNNRVERRATKLQARLDIATREEFR